MDLYGHRRLCQKIVYWNKLKAPYSLKYGQILYLPKAPTKQTEKENLVENLPTPDLKTLEALPSVVQDLKKSGTEYIYTVNSRAPWLWMVARDLYQDPLKARDIAKWNHLNAKSPLKMGQSLRILSPPTNSLEQSTALLIESWQKLGNFEMARRLGANESSLSITKAEKPIKKIEKKETQVPVLKAHKEKQEPIPKVVTVEEKPATTAALKQKKHPAIIQAVKQPPVAAQAQTPKVNIPEAIVKPVEPKTIIKTVTTQAPPIVIIQQVPTTTAPVAAAIPASLACCLRAPTAVIGHVFPVGNEPIANEYWLGPESDKIIEDISKKLPDK